MDRHAELLDDLLRSSGFRLPLRGAGMTISRYPMPPFRRKLIGLLGTLFVALGLASPTHAFDATNASTNLGVPALSLSELAQRKISLAGMGMLEVPTGAIVTADPLGIWRDRAIASSHNVSICQELFPALHPHPLQPPLSCS